MRPLSLLLATCLCAVLLYGRLTDRLPAAAGAAAAVPATASPSPSHETRAEALQRCLAASQLLEIELARYRELRAVEVADLNNVVVATFRKNLNKVLQGTWDRVVNPITYELWQQSHRYGDPELDRESHDRDMLLRRVKLYRESLCDPRTDAAKALRKQFENHPLEKEARQHEERILMFDRDREDALAVLKRT